MADFVTIDPLAVAMPIGTNPIRFNATGSIGHTVRPRDPAFTVKCRVCIEGSPDQEKDGGDCSHDHWATAAAGDFEVPNPPPITNLVALLYQGSTLVDVATSRVTFAAMRRHGEKD